MGMRCMGEMVPQKRSQTATNVESMRFDAQKTSRPEQRFSHSSRDFISPVQVACGFLGFGPVPRQRGSRYGPLSPSHSASIGYSPRLLPERSALVGPIRRSPVTDSGTLPGSSVSVLETSFEVVTLKTLMKRLRVVNGENVTRANKISSGRRPETRKP